MRLRPFELVLVIIFLALALLALLLLATFRGGGDDLPEGQIEIGRVSIWGVLPAQSVNEVLSAIKEENEFYSEVSYRYIPESQFDSVLVNALADGIGPDLVLLSHEMLIETRRRIQPISYTSYSIRDIRNAYIEGAQVFSLSDGLYALPIAVDPLMLYWNRDILATSGLLQPPETWEELVNGMFPTLVQRDFDRSIGRSVLAMGEYTNVRNAFATISTLLLQGGSGLVLDQAREYDIQLDTSLTGGKPLQAALGFYTRFSQPSNTLYNWNRSLPEDRYQFTAEDLVFYFGYGSEAREIERLNPNLNFDIAEVPQDGSATVRRTYGKFYGLAMLKSTGNVTGAGAVLYNFGGSAVADQLAIQSEMVPVYRSSVAAGSNDVFGRVRYTSAPIAYGWINPQKSATDELFAAAVRNINENRSDARGATSDLLEQLSNTY